ncbi:MAG: T9SS type A sorting domain-containing protein [Saprospiraceae bacterium]|nr:T9SS type A sorting domain-containing protein [Saprospiraceae bacterium]
MLKLFTSLSITFRILVAVAFWALPQLMEAQEAVWQKQQTDPVLEGKRQIIPEKYQVVKLDLQRLKGVLSRAPMEYTSAGRNSDVIVEIPMPNNSIQKFRVVESPIMEEGLAKRYPDIKTYAGTSIDNPSVTVRFDVTPKGFHSMIFSPEGTFFIDPFNNVTTEYYINYSKKDFKSNKAFECSVDDQQGLPTIDTHDNHKGNQPDQLDFTNSEDVGNRFGDCVLRTYRLALAATGEYTAFHGGTVALALAAQVTSMNRVNGVYIKDLAVKMILVANNDLVIYTNSATDPYTNNNGSTMLGQNQTNLDAVIGTANYDVGHVYSTGGGGIASLRSPCSSTLKARGVTGSSAPVGDPFDIDYVAHEMGHQFGGNHSYNNSCGGNRNSSTAWEPGSGTTIMGYAGICPPDIQSNSNAYFHGGNLEEMQNFITGTGNTCSSKPAYTNAFPSIVTSTAAQTIPKGTPIVLSSTATDADGNASITYCWEQMDIEISTQAPVSTATGGPNFRSFDPVTSGDRYLPRLADLVNNVSPTWEVIPTVGRVLKFRVVARDNAVGGGCNDHKDVTLTVDGSSGPLAVTAPTATGITWAGSSSQTVTWNVASTNIAPVSCSTVDILLSTDGGLTYPTTLATGVTNNGSATVTVPNVATTTARIMVKGSGRVFFDISNNNFTITASNCTAPVVSAPTVTQPTCATPTGTIVVNATGTGTLEYSVDNGANYQTSATFSSLQPGNYNIIVRIQANPTCTASYGSNPVVLNAPVGAPTAPSVGTITQPTCSVATGSVVLSGLPATGTWTLTRSPGAVTTTGTGTSTTISGLAAGTYTYTVTNDAGCTSGASGNVVINAQPATPTAPTVGTITQPTCSVATGSVVLSGLPATGTWTLTRSPGAVTTTGTGTSTTISGLAAGTYTYTVTNAAGCTSTASGNVVINAQPATPTAPSVGTITQPTCSVATGSVVLSGLPATGTWTLTRSPGAVTTTGTGTSTTISGLAAGTYTYTVTNAAGCTSGASGNVVIDGSSSVPAAPTVGTITQPTCSVATGSVVLSGLPATGTWTLTRNPGAVATTGTGTSTTISGLAAGTYTYTVTNAAGCTSTTSGNIVINAQPATPTAPSVGTITQPTCPTPTGSVVLSGLPATGTWTINPGNVTGTGTSTTLTGLVPNTYNFTVTNSAGCTSTATANVVINAAVGCCTPPTISNVSSTQPVCANGTITITAAGSGTLEYSINNGTSYGTSSVFSGLSAGTYNIKVRLQASPSCVTSAANPVTLVNGTNAAPTVTLTAPTNNSVAVTNLTLTASASDIDGTISQVNFYTVVGPSKTGQYTRTLLGSATSAPYSYTWSNIPGSFYSVQAEAVDNCGSSTLSEIAAVNVLATLNVLITSPVTGTTLVGGSTINVTAAVVNFSSRTITKIEFFSGNQKIGEDLTSPYSISWANIPTGFFSLTAKATDNTGAVWSSPTYVFNSSGAARERIQNTNSQFVSDLEVYPNPAQSQIHLNTNITQEGDYSVNIVDFSGKVILNKNVTYQKGLNTESFDTSGLPKGMYIVRLVNSGGSSVGMQKLVID